MRTIANGYNVCTSGADNDDDDDDHDGSGRWRTDAMSNEFTERASTAFPRRQRCLCKTRPVEWTLQLPIALPHVVVRRTTRKTIANEHNLQGSPLYLLKHLRSNTSCYFVSF